MASPSERGQRLMLAPVVVDLGPDVGGREVQIVIEACNRAIAAGVCLPESSPGGEAPRAVAVARAVDESVHVVRIEVRLAAEDGGAPIVRELVFGRRDPLRERWRSVGLAIATLVGEGERAREEAREEPPPEPEPEPVPEPPAVDAAPAPPEPPAAQKPPPPAVVPERAEAQEEPETAEVPDVPRAAFEHRSLFVGVGGFTGPGFGAGAWRVGGTLRAAWQAPSGLALGASFGYAWRTSTRDFTAEWLSLAAGVGYRLDASDATSFGVMLLGGAQRAAFEVLAAGESRSQAAWNAHAGIELDARWRATAGFGLWAAVEGGTVGRTRRLFAAPERDPIQAGAFDACFAVGLGWWPE